MKVFNKLFSMLAAIVVSAILPFSLAAESEASQTLNSQGASSVTTSFTDGETRGEDPAR
ncbi:hypothetical protein [Salinicola aestuarinus]|uniref:hypothetical protein n=1 Tax=Salinicola aestuarinus TaxID=1949082 RepID=UPI0013007409|nr:hypothetical protein [Salinicola aestuarinus]